MRKLNKIATLIIVACIGVCGCAGKNTLPTEEITYSNESSTVDNQASSEQQTTLKEQDNSEKQTTTEKQVVSEEQTTTKKSETSEKQTTTKRSELQTTTKKSETTEKEITTKKTESTTKEQETTKREEETTTNFVDGIYWKYSDNTLTIYGSGEMDDYFYYFSDTQSPFSKSEYREEISKIVIENGITYIGNSAFYNLPNLKTVEMSNSVCGIGEDAFKECTNLNEITFSESIVEIGLNAFENTLWLDDMLEKNNFVVVNDILISAKSDIQSIVIPDGVKVIAEYALNDCNSLKTIDIPKSVEEIKFRSLPQCYLEDALEQNDYIIINNILVAVNYNLIDIVVPNNVTAIAEGAFWNNISVNTVKIPPEVVCIAKNNLLQDYLTPIIYCTKDSYAEIWARESGYTFELE